MMGAVVSIYCNKGNKWLSPNQIVQMFQKYLDEKKCDWVVSKQRFVMIDDKAVEIDSKGKRISQVL